jgi:hypothetical protein
MWSGTAAVKITVCLVLLASVMPANAEPAARRHPGPWPIWNWHDHQPTQKQLDALHARDVSPAQARELDRLYMQLEGPSPNIVAPKQKIR